MDADFAGNMRAGERNGLDLEIMESCELESLRLVAGKKGTQEKQRQKCLKRYFHHGCMIRKILARPSPGMGDWFFFKKWRFRATSQ